MTHGSVGWRELVTPDIEGAREFYSRLFDWNVTVDNETADMPYTMFGVGDSTMAGAMAMDGDQWAGVPPHWMLYFLVDDTDASAAKAEELGGTIHVPPGDIPNIGRFSVVSDPAGATFTIIKFFPMEG